MIDVANSGAFIKKTSKEARDLISKMAVNSQQFRVRVDHMPRKVNEIMYSNIEIELSKLTSLVKQVALGQVKHSRVYGIYTFLEHSTDICL
jgi:hypothetical protein